MEFKVIIVSTLDTKDKLVFDHSLITMSFCEFR